MKARHHKHHHPEPAPQPTSEDPKTAELEQALEAAQRERDEAKDQALRALAEFQNYRKRTSNERQQGRLDATEEMATKLLPIVDNFDRAMAAAREAKDAHSLLQGIELIHKQFLMFLDQMGVRPIHSEGQPFDPNFHEAVVTTETEAHPHDTVIEELERGYTLSSGKIVRPARVRVSKLPSGTDG